MAGSLTYLALRRNKSLTKRIRVPVCQFSVSSEDRIHEAFTSLLAQDGRNCTAKPVFPNRTVHTAAQSHTRPGSPTRLPILGLTGSEYACSGVRSLRTSGVLGYQAKLTPAEVTSILRGNEYSRTELPSGPVKAFEMNSLRSNNPVEDAHAEARLTSGGEEGGGYLFGIYDGHGGAACGQVVAKRLLNYISAGFLSPLDLEKHITALEAESPADLLEYFNVNFELVQDLRDLYQRSYIEYLMKLKSSASRVGGELEHQNIESVLTDAFLTLDEDMSREAIPQAEGLVNMKTLTVAMSGCVAVVTHIDGPHLHVASTGDCTAVIGSLSENETWLAKKLTNEHNSDNQKEVERILAEHPESEHHNIIKGDRLLSVLAPLRAFGDFKFKWDKETIDSTLGAILGDNAHPPNYKTPPYLTARPEVTYHHLSPRDKFMVIGSDGLWDMMTPMQVIRLVGEHMSGKVTLSPLHLSQPHIPLEDIAQVLRQRQAAMKLKPTDSNAATHLIRCALGGTAYGVDHSRLSQMLSLPQDMVRMFRDDITITVVFFDDEYLRHC